MLKSDELNSSLPSNKKYKLKNFSSFTMIIALVVIWIIFEIITEGIFLSTRNISLLLRQMSVTGILSIGMVMLIVSGNFDISVGSAVGLTSGIAAILNVWFKWDTFTAILGALAVGAVIGVWNGFWVAYKKVPSFIVTLGGLMAFRGILLVLTQGKTVAPLSNTFVFIGGGFVPKIAGYIIFAVAIIFYITIVFRNRKTRISYNLLVENIKKTIFKIAIVLIIMVGFIILLNNYQGIPIAIMVLLFLFVIFSFISTNTVFGRNIYAIGGNEEAAFISGIKVKNRIFLAFVFMGVLAAIAGVLMTGRLNAATPSGGTGLELDAIAAVVIGGTSLSGGIGTIYGAILGALVMASLDNGMSLCNILPYYQYIVKGLILILAVWFDVSSRKK